MQNHYGARLGSFARFGPVALAVLASAGVCSAASTVTTSSPYLSTANSTLNPLSPTYYLEDFEDGVLNIPGVSFTAIGGSGVQSGPAYSVDADDGSINGAGPGSYYLGATSGGAQNNTFFFSQVAGQWPKRVAIALTGGFANSVGFAAYDTSLNPSGSLTYNGLNNGPGTADDFLITFTDNTGIAAIVIQTNNAATAMQYDHLQFDTAPVPEPAALSLLAASGLLVASRRRRAIA